MSASAQMNGKRSSSSSTVNTPASTPVSNGNSQSIPQSTTPLPNNNAPKYGTLVPNRIFVGGISANTTEGELLQLFSTYGTVKAAKIIQDRAGVSKGYGFITFESEDDAKRPLNDADNIVLKERKLNIAPAIKKQPFNRTFDAASPPTVAQGNPAPFFFPPSPGVPYFQGGVAYYPQPPPSAGGDPNAQPATVYQAPPVYPTQTGPPQAPTYPSMMFPLPHYVPQQYPMPLPYDYYNYANNGAPQYLVGNGQNVGPNGNNGNGGAGQGIGGGPSMSTSSSPPRPQQPQPAACYNQLHYNPAADALFYNLPMYAASIDGAAAAMYASDAMDGSAISNGPYNEGPFSLVDPSCASATLQQQQQDLGIDHREGGDHFGLIAPPQQQQQHQLVVEGVGKNDGMDGGRQSRTPVVSMLSMEQHPDKDFVSMQGGRRKPPQPPLQQQFQQQTQHQHHHALHHHHHHQQQMNYTSQLPPPPFYRSYQSPFGQPPPHPPPPPLSYHNYIMPSQQNHHSNLMNNNNNQLRSLYNNKTATTAPTTISNTSSNSNGLRKIKSYSSTTQRQNNNRSFHNNNNNTNANNNESANSVDDNRNEDKLANGSSVRGGYHHHMMRGGRLSQQAHQQQSLPSQPNQQKCGIYQQSVSQVVVRQQNSAAPPVGGGSGVASLSSSSVAAVTTSTNSHQHHHHFSGGGGGGGGTATTLNTTGGGLLRNHNNGNVINNNNNNNNNSSSNKGKNKMNRKSSTSQLGGGGEIGAGDAPSIDDACKKLDGLKL